MSAMTGYLKEKLLNHIVRSTTYSSPGTVYVALFENDPQGGSPVELAGAGYDRKPASFNNPSNGIVTNNGDIDFDTATSDWNEVNYIAIIDAQTSGNILFSTQLSSPINVASGNTLKIEDENLSIHL